MKSVLHSYTGLPERNTPLNANNGNRSKNFDNFLQKFSLLIVIRRLFLLQFSLFFF